jgi:hypothetical protein
VNSGDDTALYHYVQPGAEPLAKCLEVAHLAGDKLLGTALEEDRAQPEPTITHVDNHQDNLKNDPSLVSESPPPSPPASICTVIFKGLREAGITHFVHVHYSFLTIPHIRTTRNPQE